jgi:hypothetical protein
MDRCAGISSSLRHRLLWPELRKRVPNCPGSFCCAQRPRSVRIQPQRSGPANVSLPNLQDRPLCRALKSSNFSPITDIGLKFACSDFGNSNCRSGANRENLSGTDLATRSLDLHGWKVVLQDTKEVVGYVDETIHIGSADSDEVFETVLKLVCGSLDLDKDSDDSLGDDEITEDVDQLEFLVPLVGEIVREVDVDNQCLFITVSQLLHIIRSHVLNGLILCYFLSFEGSFFRSIDFQ